jgi:hypothetical protein
MAAPGTKIDTMIEEPVVDGLGREWIPFVFRVARLATDLALSLTIRGRRLGRLDDVRRRGAWKMSRNSSAPPRVAPKAERP